MNIRDLNEGFVSSFLNKVKGMFSKPLFHITTLDAAHRIIAQDKLVGSFSFIEPETTHDKNKSSFYVSTTSNRRNSYAITLLKSETGSFVYLNFNRKISEFKPTTVNFYDAILSGDGVTIDRHTASLVTEDEFRIYLPKPSISPLSSYLKSIDIYVDSWDLDFGRVSNVIYIIKNSKVPVYVYKTFGSFVMRKNGISGEKFIEEYLDVKPTAPKKDKLFTSLRPIASNLVSEVLKAYYSGVRYKVSEEDVDHPTYQSKKSPKQKALDILTQYLFGATRNSLSLTKKDQELIDIITKDGEYFRAFLSKHLK